MYKLHGGTDPGTWVLLGLRCILISKLSNTLLSGVCQVCGLGCAWFGVNDVLTATGQGDLPCALLGVYQQCQSQYHIWNISCLLVGEWEI